MQSVCKNRISQQRENYSNNEYLGGPRPVSAEHVLLLKFTGTHKKFIIVKRRADIGHCMVSAVQGSAGL